MADPTLFDQVKAPENRAYPYPLYARLRETPVSRQRNGEGAEVYVAATHAAVSALVSDPRISSQTLPPAERPATGNPFTDWIVNPIRERITDAHRPFIFRDPPDHDALRAAVMGQFTHRRVAGMQARSDALVAELLEAKRGAGVIDVVDDLAYPLPVTVICELLGVPPEDERQFHAWSQQLATALEPDSAADAETRAANSRTFDAISAYMGDLIAEKRKRPRDDMLSGLAGARGTAGGMGDFDLISTAILLLVAGHETTVNLIANGMLTLLRHPAALARLRAEPAFAPRVVEELLRYEPPVQFRTRRALADIAVAGCTIPAGADVVLLLAAGNRDPEAFARPDAFDPDRHDNRHLGFGGSLHYCVGAPLARIEAAAALAALARRLEAPALVQDPPPYRPGAALRGPRHLRVAVSGLA